MKVGPLFFILATLVTLVAADSSHSVESDIQKPEERDALKDVTPYERVLQKRILSVLKPVDVAEVEEEGSPLHRTLQGGRQRARRRMMRNGGKGKGKGGGSKSSKGSGGGGKGRRRRRRMRQRAMRMRMRMRMRMMTNTAFPTAPTSSLPPGVTSAPTKGGGASAGPTVKATTATPGSPTKVPGSAGPTAKTTTLAPGASAGPTAKTTTATPGTSPAPTAKTTTAVPAA